MSGLTASTRWLCSALVVLALPACAIGDAGPPPADAPAAAAVERAAKIALLAEEIRATAHELTSLTDESRRKVAAGDSTPADEIEKMRLLTAQLESKQAELQREMDALEAELHTAAGDPSWPQEEVPGRR